MNVMSMLKGKVKTGTVLATRVQGSKFKVQNISPLGITILIGKGWRTPIPAKCWNGIPDFLKGKGWVEIGAIHNYKCKSGTLEDFVNNTKSQKRSTANYVASILEYTGIVEIDRTPPSKVRLII